MKSYSIVRVGNGYVVQAEAKSILRIASRRMAVRLVVEAAELLDASGESEAAATTGLAPSIARDRSDVS
jgi:hypothetical protein